MSEHQGARMDDALSKAIEDVWYAQGLDVRGAEISKFMGALNAALSSVEPAHTMEEDFQHFLTYSGLRSEPDRVIEKLRMAFDAAWEPSFGISSVEQEPAVFMCANVDFTSYTTSKRIADERRNQGCDVTPLYTSPIASGKDAQDIKTAFFEGYGEAVEDARNGRPPVIEAAWKRVLAQKGGGNV